MCACVSVTVCARMCLAVYLNFNNCCHNLGGAAAANVVANCGAVENK